MRLYADLATGGKDEKMKLLQPQWEKNRDESGIILETLELVLKAPHEYRGPERACFPLFGM